MRRARSCSRVARRRRSSRSYGRTTRSCSGMSTTGAATRGTHGARAEPRTTSPPSAIAMGTCSGSSPIRSGASSGTCTPTGRGPGIPRASGTAAQSSNLRSPTWPAGFSVGDERTWAPSILVGELDRVLRVLPRVPELLDRLFVIELAPLLVCFLELLLGLLELVLHLLGVLRVLDWHLFRVVQRC